jgi:hypothetical protein
MLISGRRSSQDRTAFSILVESATSSVSGLLWKIKQKLQIPFKQNILLRRLQGGEGEVGPLLTSSDSLKDARLGHKDEVVDHWWSSWLHSAEGMCLSTRRGIPKRYGS